MSPIPYINPLSPVQIGGTISVPREVNFGVAYSTNLVGGYMEVESLNNLNYTIPFGTSGLTQFSGNSIPISFVKGNGTGYSPDVLFLNNDNISSGRRKLGMLVFVREQGQIYQYNIDGYETLWNSATASTGTVEISYLGTTVNNTSAAGQNFINAWTASTIDGVGGFTASNAKWKKYYGTNLALTGGSFNSITGILTLTNITGGTQSLTGFGSGGGGGSGITGGTFNQNTLDLDLNSTGGTITINNVTGLYISAGTYNSGTTTLSLLNSTGGTISITGFTSGSGGGSSNLQYFITGSTPSGVTINSGDRWFDTDTGVEVVYINDGDSSQWVRPSNGMVPLFTGNTSATCITSLYVSNIYGCSPININDLVIANSGITTTSLTATTISATTYQNLPFSGTVGGTGASNYVTKWSDGINITDSVIYDNGSFVGINATGPIYSEPISFQTSNRGITIDSLNVVLNANDSIAVGNSDYTSWGTSGNEFVFGTGGNLASSTGGQNVAIGNKSLSQNVSGDRNVAIGGSRCLDSNDSGGRNIAIGYNSMHLNYDGANNVAIGDGSLTSNVSGQYNIAIGNGSGAGTNSDGNIFVGQNAGAYNQTGVENVTIGQNSLLLNVSGGQNVAIGLNSLYSTDSSRNVGIGRNAGYSNVSGIGNVFLGDGSGYSNDGNYNIFIGYGAAGTDTASSYKLNIGETIIGDLVSKSISVPTISATTYQNLPSSVGGVGTTDYIPLWTGTTQIGNSIMYQSATNPGFTNIVTIDGVAAGNGVFLDINTANQNFSGSRFKITGTTYFQIGTSNSVSINSFFIQSYTNTGSVVGYPFKIPNGTTRVIINEATDDNVSALNVNGRVRATSVSATTYFNLPFSGTVVGTGTSGYIPKWTGTTGVSNSVLYESGSKIAIGNTNPQALLDIQTTSTEGLFVSGNTAALRDLVRITQTGLGNAFVVEDSSNPDSTPFVINTTGNVGIGTTSPSETLHVSGNSIISGTLTGSTIIATTSFSGISSTILSSKGYVLTQGNPSRAFITISGSNTNGGADYVDFIRVINTAAGATNTNKFFTVDKTGSFQVYDSAYNKAILNLTNSGSLTVTDSSFVNGNLTITGTTSSPTFTGGSITLSNSASTISLNNTTRQQIRFFSGGTGAPTYNTYSAGAKIILSDNIDSISSGYAIGVDAGSLWYGADLAGNGHNWYAGTNKLMSLFSSSGLELVGLGGPTTTTMTISGTSVLGSKGGVGYIDFLKVVNNFSGATNPNKWFRVNSTGGLEILRSDYNATILTISDGGIMAVGGGNVATTTSSDGTSNYLSFGNNNTQIYDDGNTHIHSRTANQSMWINTNNGQINIGTQSPVAGGGIASAIAFATGTANGYVTINTGRTVTTAAAYGYLTTGGAGTYPGGSQSVVISLYANSRIWGQEIDAFSDERMKDIHGEITLEEGIKLVKNLKPIKYNWKEGDDKGTKAGYSAQQVIKSGFDHLIGLIPTEGLEETIDDDGFLSPKDTQFAMNYDQVTPYHGVVIKHLLEEIENLKNEIKELKSKIG